MYSDQDNMHQALKEFENSISIFIELKDSNRVADILVNLGFTYAKLQRIDKSLECYTKAISIYEKVKSKHGICWVYNCIGDMYKEANKNLKSALIYYEKSLLMANEMNDNDRRFRLINRIGNVYRDLEKYDTSIEYIKQGLKIAQELENENHIAWSYSSLAKVFFKQKDFKQAKHYSDLSLTLIKKQNFASSIMGLEKLAATIDSAYGSYKDAFGHYQQYIIIRDKLNSDELNKLAMRQKYTEEADKQKAEQDKKDIYALEQKKNQQIIIFAVAGILIIVLVFSSLLFKRFKLTNKQKEIIEEKHKEISDSINYAERIQRSFLATADLLDENLKDYFVFFQPKDVVSGDFYWATKLVSSSGVENFALVTADSTGHGVPGAIMSLLNVTSLESAIKDGHNEPSEILNHTRQTIIERLKKDGSDEGGKDGMDASIVCFDFKNNKLTYSAANNPIWVVRKNELIELKGDKMPVGKHDKDYVSFTQQEFKLIKGDVIYTLTDGFPDQFGGTKGKKFMYKQLKETLVSISNKPLIEQKETLTTILKNWMGDIEQVDDIIIIGIRI